MKTCLRLLISVMVLQLLSSAPSHADDCETGATNMAEVRACLAGKLDSELASAFENTLSFVKAKDGEAAKLLLTAQTSWKKFAEDSCNYSVAARQSVQMENDARLACWSSFVRARINVLNVYRRDFGRAAL